MDGRLNGEPSRGAAIHIVNPGPGEGEIPDENSVRRRSGRRDRLRTRRRLDAYTKEYAPKAQALIKASGGRLLAAGQNVTSIEGAPPKPRVAVQVWDSMEKIRAWRNSAEFKEIRKIGEKYAKFRSFTVEGLPQ